MVDLDPIEPNNMMDKEEFGGRDREELGNRSDEARMFIITNNDEAARLIGSGGEKVTKLRNEFTGIKLRIGNKVPGVDEQVTEVQGPLERVNELLMRIAEITREPRSDNDPMLTLLVHNAGGLIGTGGQRVTRIRKESGATIKIAKDNLPRSSQTPVTVTGRLESLEKATRMILEFIITCEPVTNIYSPDNHLNRRGGREDRLGSRDRRRDRSRDRRGSGFRDGSRDRSRGGRNGGRRDFGGGWPRRGERDFGDRGDRWGSRDGDRWGSRDYGRGFAGYGGRSGGGWGPRESVGGGGNRRDDYDPFEPTSSRRSLSVPSNGGWDRPDGRSDTGWQSSNDDQRGWAQPRDSERGWGPSRSAGGGGGWGGPSNDGWGGPPDRSRRDFGEPRGNGGW